MASGLKLVSVAQIDFSNTGSIAAAFAAVRIRSFHRIATPEGGGVSLAEASSDVLPDELPPSPAAANAKLGLKSRYNTTAAATATRLNAPISPEFIFISPVTSSECCRGCTSKPHSPRPPAPTRSRRDEFSLALTSKEI